MTAVLFALAVWLCLAPPAMGQTGGQIELQPGVSWGGVGFFTPNQWGLVRSSVINHGADEVSGLLTITSRGSGNVQFAKELWVPPNSQLSTVTPYRLARLPSDGQRGLEAEGAFIASIGGRETVLDSEQGMLNIREGGFQTAVIAGEGGDSLIAMAAALRETAGLPPTTAYVSAEAAPSFAPAWEAIDLILFGHRDPQFQAGQIEAMRRFLLGGGRVWIDLTRVSPEVAGRLIGDEWNVSVIDRIGINEFTIEGAGGPQAVAFDYPVDHVRVVAPDMETLHSVNGYPATLRKNVGQGTLFVLTLEPEAWVDAERKSTPALKSLTWLLRQSREAEPQEAKLQVLQAVASEQIGYSVIGRAPVAIVLGVFTLLLLAAGLWLSRRGDLAKLGWIAPVIAVVAAAALLGLGLTRQSEVPFTLASAEILEVTPGAPYARATSLVSVYTPWGASRGDAALRGQGEPTWPDLQNHAGQNVRVVWTGDRHWRFDNLALREGAVQTAGREAVTPLATTITAAARLTAEGLRGEVDAGELGTLEDAVILTPTGKLTVEMGEGGAFATPAADPLGPSQYFPGTVLGQRQMARQEAYRQLVASRHFPERPVLAGWVEGGTSGVEVSDQAQRRARALVIVPLTIQPPAAGDAVAVPAPLMEMTTYRGNRELMSAPIYDERTREWVPTISNAQTALMAFQLPRGVEQMKVTSARVLVDLTAVGRTFDVVIYEGDGVHEVFHGESPAGTQVIELTGADAPQPLPDGAVVVGIRVSEPVDPLSSEPWSLKRMEVGVTGVAE